MPAIKITLQRLIELFGKSVNDLGLDQPVRALAARLMTLTAHSIRIESKVDTLDKNLGQLAEIVQLLAPQQGQPAQTAAPSPAVPAAAAAAAAVPAPVAAEEEEEEPDEFRRVQAEAAAEVARANAGLSDDVTPLRKPAGAA